MSRPRDAQRSAVYAWERAIVGRSFFGGTLDREECEAFVARVWLAERARYGRGRTPAPKMRQGGRGARGDYYGHEVSLGRWARNPWIASHEVAHVLVGPRRGWHGPRFVGALIGIAARHLGHDAELLMVKADEMGVRYDVRSIGAVPTIALADKVAKHLPGTAIEIAVALDISYRQVHGAALRLIQQRRAAWRGRTLRATEATS